MLTPQMHLNQRRFDPSQFPSVLYWIDAADTKGVGDGSALTIASVFDKSSKRLGPLQTAGGAIYKASGGDAGRPYWSFDGSTQYLRTPSFAVTHPRIFCVGHATELGLNGRFFDGNTFNTAYMDMSGIPAGVQINGSTTTQCRTLATALDTTKVCLFDCRFNGASSSLQIDQNILKTGSVGTASVSDGFCIGAPGNLFAGYFRGMRLYEFIVCDDDLLTAAQIDYIRRGLLVKHRIRTRNVLYGDGNSWIAGTGASGGNDMISVVTRGLGGSAYVLTTNEGSGGQTIHQMTASPGSDDIYQGFFRSSTLVVWEGRNDIVTNSIDGATAYANMKTFLQARQAAGWKGSRAPTPGNDNIVLLDIDTSGTGMSGAALTAAQDYNTLVAANTAGAGDKVADALIHVDGLSLGVPASDGLHYNDAQYATVANIVLNAIRSFGPIA
jgi:hypothetical protein